MKTRNLRYFAAMIDHGGVTRAAERLRVTQPAVTAGLKALEEELGCALLERDGGPARPTAAGRRLYRRAVEILRLCDVAQAEVRDAGAAPPRLGLAATLPDRGVRALAAALAGPVRYRSGPVDRVAAWLRHGRIDAAVTVAGDRPPPGRGRALAVEPFVAVVAPGHRLAAAGTLPLAALDREPLVVRASCERRREADGLFRAAGVAPVVVAVADGDATALALVRAGVGLALVPRSLADGGVVALVVEGLALERIVTLLWRADAPAGWIDALAPAAAGAFG